MSILKRFPHFRGIYIWGKKWCLHFFHVSFTRGSTVALHVPVCVCVCVCVCVLKLSIHQIMEASGNRVKKINPHSGGGGRGKREILGPIGIVIILL